jgi:hypothetical protein
MTHACRRSVALAAVLLALGALAAGCGSMQSAEQRAEQDAERCKAGGREPDSKEFKECVTRLASDRDARVQARHREMMERSMAPPITRGQ